MWKWGSGDDSPSKTAAAGSGDVKSTAVTDLMEQLTSTEQLLAQLKELVKEKDAELRSKDLQLKEEKESADAKLSKLKLQNKAKVASLTSQLEELKKQLPVAGSLEAKAEPKKASKDGDQENAAANRGKILVLRRRIEELESQITQKNEELQKKDAELEAQRSRGADMDAMLAEKEKKLAERDAYIRDLQVACGSSDAANQIFLPNEELKNQLTAKESSLQSMEILVQNLTKKVGDSEEKCSLFQEQIESLKNIQSKEREHFQGKEATYMENIRVFQNIIQEKEKELEAQREKHEQELFRLAAKSDASADLEQLLKALKQKLHEKEEVMLGRTQVIDVLQKELDAKDQQLKEINENLKRLLSEKENLQSKLDAEKHVMRAQLKDMMEKHELEMTKVKAKYNAELHEIQEKHETELQEKDQALVQLQKRVAELSGDGQSNSKEVKDLESITKEKMEDLEVQVKLKTEEASKSEAKFLKMKAWSKSRIKQLEDELKNFSSKNNDVSALSNRVSELEVENEELQSKLQSLHEIGTQNEELLKKLELYEEQQRKLQADLDQVTKRAASQASESGSVDELQNQLLEWQENVPESEESRDQVREEKSSMALRMAQIEEEREGLIEDDWFFPGCSDPAIVSGQQELEEELATVQGMGRLQQARRKGSQTSRKLQEEFPFDGKQCFQELNVTLDSTDSAEGENMGGWWPEYPSPNAGLRSVVEELELERNHLQEQILFLEERCQDLEDRFQLQGRMEALQNENERLQTQLTQLRNQQMRDVEKHQILISGLNEQLKGLSDRNSFLENSLGEREQKLVSTTEKLEQVETLRKLLQEKDILNKELGEKFVYAEQKLNEALKKCSVYEAENVEQKTAITDLTERVATLKEKTLKQDSMVESMQLDLDQTNEELDKLNSSHLEERSQLIQDLQKREREIDNLKEVLSEKDREMSVLSLNMTEYSEQVMILKHQVQCKEEELRGLEEALLKAEREMHLLKEVQTADVRDASMKISALSEQSDTMRMELERARAENEAKTKENEELIRQSTENSLTIKDLRSEIKANNVAYHNNLAECESQIALLKEQITISSEKLQEKEDKRRKEMECLKSQLEESNAVKEKWNCLLKEKESKAQMLENELKSIKDSYNKLALENAKKDEELVELSRKLKEHADHEETAKKELQKKQELIISLEQKLGALEKQNEETKLKLIEDLKAKETCCKELNDQLNEINKQIKKWEIETQEKASANSQLQADIEGKQEKLTEQIKTNEYLKKSIGTMENEKEQLIRENENLSKLLDVKECELLKKIQAVAELENKLSVSTAEYEKTLSVLNCDKNTLAKEIEQLSVVAKQKESSVAEQLGEKTKECNVLAEQLSESKEQTQQLHEQVQSLLIQLKEIRDEEVKKEEMLNNKISECSGLVQELSRSKEKNLLLQEQIQSITLDFETANKSLEEKNLQNHSLHKEMEEHKLCVVELQDEIKNLKDEKTKFTQLVEERDLAVKSQGSELEKFQRQIFEKIEENTGLNNQLQLLSKEVEVLRHEKEDFSRLLSEKTDECKCLQSEIASARHQAETSALENKKLKTDIETVNVTVIKKSEEIAALTSHLSQQSHSILDLRDQIDSLLMEKENLKITFEEKETLLSEKEALIKEMKDKVSGEERYVELIADLRYQIQALNFEADELRHAMQEKDNEFKRQAQEFKLLKNKSEESDVLRVQLSENMEVISNLQSQLKNMTEQASQLNDSIAKKDASLKEKVDECIGLKAQLSAIQDSCVVQEKQLQLLASEAEQLKVLVSEKESTINSISTLSENLKMQLQEKETECGVLKKQMVELQEMKDNFQKEIECQKNVIIEMDQSLSEKESSLIESKSLLETLKEKAKKDEEKTHLISQLQSQVLELTQELENSKELVREKENTFLSLQEKTEAQYKLRTELNVALGHKDEVIAGLLNSLKEKDASIQLAESNVNALSSEIDVLRSKLEESGTAMKNLTEEFQEKNKKLDNHKKKIDSLTVELDSLNSEHQKALDQINTQEQELQKKDLAVESLRVTCTEQAEKLECLKLEFNNVNSKSSQDCHDNVLLINSLQHQVDSLEKEKNLLQDDVGKLMAENSQLTASQADLQKKLEELWEIHEKLETSENYSRMQIDAVKLQMKTEKEKLQMQVSVKGEEISKLELKCQTLELSLLESENKWVAELDRANSQNNDLTEQLSSLESEMKSKDSEIQSLQQELDLIKEKLTQSLSPLLSSRFLSKEKKAPISDSELQPTDSKTQLEKFSTLVAAILSKEREGECLQLALLEKQKEIDTMKDELRSMELLEKQKEVLQSDMEKMKGKYMSEMECLSKEMVSLKETVGKQECLLKEREESLAEINKQVEFLQDKMNKSEEMLRTSQEKLQAEGKKVVSLLEEIGEKDHLIENLTSQVNQQKDLISGLSQQMKEKDSSVTQVMESLSNEMLNFSQERSTLNAKLEDLEAVHNSSVAELNGVLQELGDCKKELEHSQVMLSSREAEFKELMNEKEELKCNLEKMGKEKENLKKKLQAALIVRRDLMQKVGKLEKSGQEEIEKEQKKAEELLKQVNELTDKLKLIEGQSNDFESHLGTLKQQLVEKDAKISDLTKTLSSRASYLVELQHNIAELNDVIAEKQNVCEQNLKSLREKDCMLAHLQSVLDERARAYQEERSQLLLTLEEVKSELKNKEELLKNSSSEEPRSSVGNECLNPNNDVNAMNQLHKEKEALQRELLFMKEDMKKIQQEREEHMKLAADFDDQKTHLEQLREEHKALWEVLQTKWKELGFNQLEAKELLPSKALLGEEQADPRSLESDKPRNKVQVASLKESENTVTSVPNENIELKELRSNYAKLQEETEMLRKELRKIFVESGNDKEETKSLKSGRQEEQCQDSLLEDIKHLHKKLKAHQTETVELKAVLEHVNNEKKALIKKSEEDYRRSQEELQRSQIEAKQTVEGKNEEIEALRCSLKDLKERLGLEKELLNKAIKESQEEAHHYKTAFEDMKSEKEQLLSSLEKYNLELIKMKKEVEHFSEENKNLVAELCMLREKAEMSKSVVLGKELKEENGTEKELGEVSSESNSLQGNLEGKVTALQLSETDYSGKTKLREATQCEIQEQMQKVEEPLAKPANLNDSKAQEQRAVTEERSRERLQRKLQAALISRKEALRENKCLKEQIDQLMLEREELVNKTGMLEHLLELGREKQSSSAVAPLSAEESLASENARLLTENENLTAACESLKSTMESIVQEKEAFSFQLNTLKDSQTVELTGWKAKHSELKQEYESLLQAYENISSKVADMRQVIDLSRKEKQEAVQRLREGQSEKEALQKHLQNLLDENEVIKSQLKQLGESKKTEVEELQSKAESQIREQEARMQEHQDRLCELTEQNHQLMEENEQLKQTSENLKQALEKIQNENDVLHNNITVTKAALGELQVQMEVYQNDTQSKISEALCENESLLKDINVLKDKLSEKEQAVLVLEQERKLISEKAQETEKSLLHKTHCLTKLDTECKSLTQEIVSLNEKVKILEDDKCLLQEELENVQESSYKVKSEREFLETELLNHVKKVDHLTDRMKSAQVQNNLLLQQLEELKAEKSNVVREKEEQQLHLVKIFEEKVKSAQRDNNGTKNKTKELQELLKEKQQEINQLQKDSIKFQELILDLERSVKLSQSKNEKFEKDLSNASEKLAESNDEILNLKGKLTAQMNLLDQSKREVDRLKDENLNWRKELQKKGDELQLQKRGYERELEFHLQQLKLLHKSEISNLEERHGALEREKARAMSEVQGLQEELSTKDSQNKQLQADLNAALARLAAFTKCMSSLQDDRDRVITEMKTWEMQFKEAIQNKEKQLEDSNKRIVALQDELKDKMTQIQELNIKYFVVEETKDELYLRQKSVDMQRYEELCRIKEENTFFFNRQQELESALQSKEEALQALLKENNSLNHLIENSKSAGREIKALESNFTRQEQELQELLAEKEKINAELQKQITISEQMKIMLNNKDKEISLLISSKGDEISDYLMQVQTQHRNQIKDYELQVRSLQMERQQAEESCQRLENELRNLQVKAEKASQERAVIASEIDAFKKSMSSLQNDRDDLFTRYKELEHLHQDVLNQRDSLLVGSASETNSLKQELRVLLNRIDDLHSENAMLSAQLIKYREDLNQVLSLKDHQLKDLLKQKLECIKSLEHEKYDLQKQIKEMQLSSELQKGAAVALEHENKKLASKVSDLESLITSLNKEKLVSESGEKLLSSESIQKKESNRQHGGKLQEKVQELQKSRGRNADEEYSGTFWTSEDGDKPDASAEKMLLEVQSQNRELRSQNEAFGKAMTALQNDRDHIIEDFKVLQSKYISELKTERKKGDELAAELEGFKSQLMNSLRENSLLRGAVLDAADQVTLAQVADDIGTVCRTLVSRELEVSRLSAECGNYVQQMEAFAKAMASLQDDRDKLLQELSHQKAKEGASLAAVEISKLKNKVDDLEKALQQTKAFQAETEREITSYQNELAGLRMEKNLLLSESQALRNQCQITVAEKDRQIAELQRLQQDMIGKKSLPAGSSYPVKALETASLAGSEDGAEEIKHVLAEKNQLQTELQRCLQEMQQKDLHFQQINSKVMQSAEENAVLSAQLKTLSQTLRDNQLHYTDLQNRYIRLEREYQAMQVTSFQGSVQDETRAEVPPGAPQERSGIIVEIDNMELNELRKRLAETEQQYESMQQSLSQLTETLAEERRRREAAEEALGLSEERGNRFEVGSYRSVPSDYTVQMEDEEEREALIINPSEHVVVRKMKGGALSLRRWLRGRSLYCSKLLTARAKSRYLFLTYLVTLHILVVLCLTGVL
uniref:golgin subfamily B member 1 isoform X1 n=3 Tax=Lonchura striata TaxID=40157 RepID=UPI000B4C63F2|nr:golgin subfamily B member 1 isoform X1 [Lonchura striata domestica]XP_021411577.1 golgin subfamily B member 1 isoform X1 [Lonchura striata domestica]XP_031360959.1 golgin subfamily B member 1 isoform X1 [Lonchura striata domestica]